MVKPRAVLFTDDEVDLSGFSPKSKIDSSNPSKEQVRIVAEASDFRSREPLNSAASDVDVAARRKPRYHRTGRNIQFNVKASQSAVDLFYKISEDNNWVLGETLERALAALLREVGGEKTKAD